MLGVKVGEEGHDKGMVVVQGLQQQLCQLMVSGVTSTLL